ncbi:MAG: CoA pyrophosphatase [Actinomycetota bacterium]|nr:CoA pyrophosphatase [Actinomycetota bacterium]
MASELEQRLRAAFADHSPASVTLPDARAAAVLVPFYPAPEPTLIFTVRSEHLSKHKGQISFPGGSIDATDASAADAALREAHEEIGLDPAAVTVVGQLDDTPTFVSGYVVTPVVGVLGERPRLSPNPAEVAKVLEVPLDDLVEDIRREPGFSERGRTYPTEAWVWHGHVIWGVTARLLRVLLGRLSDAGLTKPPGATTSWTTWPPPVAAP